MLYETNFCNISEEHQSLIESNIPLAMPRSISTLDVPKAVRHYRSLFPNFYLDPRELRESEDALSLKISEFQNLLDRQETKEQDIIRHIKENRTWFIIGSILGQRFKFGHHATYLFPEFPLGIQYRPDYLIAGKGSGGYQFVFVELEKCNGSNIILKDGELGKTFRDGIKQVKDWQRWMDAKYSSQIESAFQSKTKPGDSLPSEFRIYDSSRVHFVVVAGRRSDFKERTYTIKREYQSNRIHLLHYDNLLDEATKLIGEKTY